MPGRRAFLQQVCGGGGVLLGHGFVAPARPARAAQRKRDPCCPTCGAVFGLTIGNNVAPGCVETEGSVNYLLVPMGEIFEPGKAWPVVCRCGWAGRAVFFEAQEI